MARMDTDFWSLTAKGAGSGTGDGRYRMPDARGGNRRWTLMDASRQARDGRLGKGSEQDGQDA